jgi:plasmid stabilization system protein ParE
MTYRIQVAQKAKDDQRQAVRYFAEHYSEAFAKRWNDGVELAIKSLENVPERCGLVHENDRLSMDVRKLLYATTKKQRHRILFAVEGDIVYVLRIRHSAQRDVGEHDLLPGENG